MNPRTLTHAGLVLALLLCVVGAHGQTSGGRAAPPATYGTPTVEGLATVEPSSGTPSSTLPIEIPSARGGLSSPLSGLAYHMHAGTLEAGEDWGFSIPTIQRDNRGELLAYEKGDPKRNEALDPAKADRFLYNGAPLVPICTLGFPGANCQDLFPSFPEWATRDHWHYFRLEREGIFARFFWSPDGMTWVIQRKDGSVDELGQSRSVQTPQLPAAIEHHPDWTALAPRIARWNLVTQRRAVSDTGLPENDALAVYVWRRHGARQLGYLEDVYDTVRAGGSSKVFADYVHHVRLRWEATGSAPSRGPIERAHAEQRVQGIDVSSASFLGAARTGVRRYHLGYEDVDGRSWLTSLQLEGRCVDAPVAEKVDDHTGVPALPVGSSCPRMPALRLAYTRAAMPFMIIQHSYGDAVTNLAGASFFDANQDGLPDLVEPVNADRIDVHINTGTSFARKVAIAIDRPAATIAGPVPSSPSRGALFQDGQGVLALGDWTGRGKQEVLFTPTWRDQPAGVAAPDYGRFFQVFLPEATPPGSSAPFAFKFKGLIPVNLGEPASATHRDPTIEYVGDIDGNALPDLIVRSYEDNPGHTTFTEHRRVLFSHRTPFGSIEPFKTASAEIGTDPFATNRTVNETSLADMDGDGVVDEVLYEAQLGRVSYASGYGDGRFGCPVDRACFSAAIPDQSGGKPLTSDRVHFEDVTADGFADVVLEADTGIVVLVNIGGERLERRATLPDVRRMAGNAPGKLLFADLNGTGSTDVVIITGGGTLFAYELAAAGYTSSTSQSVGLGLLREVANGVGARTQVEYDTLTNRMLAARSSGAPWTAISPAVVPVVTRTKTVTDAPTAYSPSATAEYEYRDPLYDGWMHRLVGFGSQKTTLQSSAKWVVSESTFVQSPCLRMPSDCSGSMRANDPLRALIGFERLVKVKEFGGRELFWQFTMPKLAQTAGGIDGRSVRFAAPWTTETYIIDGPTPSTTSTSIPVVLTDIPAVNDYLRATPGGAFVPVDLPKGAVRLKREISVDPTAGNPTLVRDYGRMDASGKSSDSVLENLTEWRDVSLAGNWVWRTTSVTRQTTDRNDATKAPFVDYPRQYGFEYDALGRVIRKTSVLKGSEALLRSHEDPSKAIAPTPTGVSRDGTVELANFAGRYDAWGNVTEAIKPNGGCSRFSYDAFAKQLPTGTKVFTAPGCSGTSIDNMTIYDRELERPVTRIAPSGAASTTEYDGFGRVVRVFQADPAQGGVQTEASATVEYFDTSPFTVEHVSSRVQGGVIEQWSFADGLRRPLATLSPGDVAGEWIVSGVTHRTYNSSTALDPFKWRGQPNTFAIASAVPSGLMGIRTVFDGFGRPEMVQSRSGLTEGRFEYKPFVRTTYDAEDANPASTHANTPTVTEWDGHGRLVRTREPFKTPSGAMDAIESRLIYLSGGEVGSVVQRHDAKPAEVFTRWMFYDSLGRLVVNGEPNTSVGFVASPTKAQIDAMKTWRYVYDDAGDLLGTSDARGCGVNASYDAAGRRIADDVSPCLREHADYTAPNLTTGDGTEAFFRYDAPEPGPASAQAPARFWMGMLAGAYGPASHTQVAYDARGRSTYVAKRVAKPGPPDAQLTARYAGHWYSASTEFDDAGRVLSTGTGADVDELLGTAGTSRVVHTYTPRGLVASIEGSYGPLARPLRFDEFGVPIVTAYGDDVVHDSKSIDPLTRRVRGYQIRTMAPPTGTPTMLVSNAYLYDRVGNVTKVEDLRDAAEWPTGAKPVTQIIGYDDLYRTTSVQSLSGNDDFVSPLAPELTRGAASVLPPRVVGVPKRATKQSFAYDWQGNTTSTLDDAGAFFDRSLGAIVNGDGAGGLLNAPHQLRHADLGSESADLAYDATGNVIASVVVRAGGTCGQPLCTHKFMYAWNERGILSRARRWDFAQAPSGAVTDEPLGPPAAELAFSYSEGGERVIKETRLPGKPSRFSVDVFGTLRLVEAAWDATGIDYERNARTETLYLAGIARVLKVSDDATIAPLGRVRTFLELGDHRGGTAVVVDQGTGELVERTTYQPFGATESDHRPARWGSFRETFRLTGKEEDLEMGLLYFGARYYSPQLGRWLSADPLSVHGGGAGGLNPYAYVGGNLMTAIDPTGLAPKADPPERIGEPPVEGAVAWVIMPAGTAGTNDYRGFGNVKEAYEAAVAEARKVPGASVGMTEETARAVTKDAIKSAFGNASDAQGSLYAKAADSVSSGSEAGKEGGTSSGKPGGNGTGEGEPEGGHNGTASPLNPVVAAAALSMAMDPTPKPDGAPAGIPIGHGHGKEGDQVMQAVFAAVVFLPHAKVAALAGRTTFERLAANAAMESVAAEEVTVFGAGVNSRVQALTAAIPEGTRGRITMAVGVTEDGSVLIGTSEPGGYLRPGVTLSPGETMVTGTGHAEADIVLHAQANGIQLSQVGATRPICPSCAALIKGARATPVTSLKVVR